MDPNKYKEEYQKKLYKMLTGQQSGREAETGKKQEMKKDDKDLLNIFSRYAAGELPRAALKSFVRQAQLERKVKAGKTEGKMWWNVQWDNNRRIEVVATSKQEAKQVAAKEWGVSEGALAGAVITPLRPYEEPADKATGPTLNGRPSNPDGNWIIVDTQDTSTPVYRYMASDNTDAFNVLRQWIAANPGREWNFAQDSTQRRGQPGEQSNQQHSGLYKIFSTTGGLIAGDEYGSDQAALERAAYYAQQRGVDVVVRYEGEEIGRVNSSGTITPTAQQPAQQPKK
jgi:hypothetical protein